MYVMRVDMENGAHFEFCFTNQEVAFAKAAIPGDRPFMTITDDFDRTSMLRVENIQHIMVVHLRVELEMQVTQSMDMQAWKDEAVNAYTRAAAAKIVPVRPALLDAKGAPLTHLHNGSRV